MTIHVARSLIASPFFKAFLHPDADRCACITGWLSSQQIPYRTVTLKDKTHIIVRYGPEAYDTRYRMKTLIAHYDRAAGSPGANDNSAACIQLMYFALKLFKSKTVHNIRIIFTDGEEAGCRGIREQGAYRLGQGLRALNMHNDDVFVFDMCGAGDTLVLSQSGIYGRDEKNTAALSALHKRSCTYAETVCRNCWCPLPTAYSDNAGLISAGINAQVITVLPAKEAQTLKRYLPACSSRTVLMPMKDAVDLNVRQESALYALTQCIISNKKIPPDSPFADVIPQTWQRMHTAADSIDTLTPEAFALVERYLLMLALLKEPLTADI